VQEQQWLAAAAIVVVELKALTLIIMASGYSGATLE